jgi:hypothetical protein
LQQKQNKEYNQKTRREQVYLDTLSTEELYHYYILVVTLPTITLGSTGSLGCRQDTSKESKRVIYKTFCRYEIKEGRNRFIYF